MAPVFESIRMGSSVKGTLVGPATTAAPCAGSKVAPWQGQKRKPDPGSNSTVQPAWVQTASNATTLPVASFTRTPGSPVCGSWKASEPPWLVRAARVPTTVPFGAAVGPALGAALPGPVPGPGGGGASSPITPVR